MAKSRCKRGKPKRARRYRRNNAKGSFSVPRFLVKGTRVLTTLSSLVQTQNSWWTGLLYYGTVAMKLFSASVGANRGFDGTTLPIGSCQCVLVRPDDLLRRSRWAYKGTGADMYICPFSRMFPHKLSFRVSNVAPGAYRRGTLAVLFQPVTLAEALSSKVRSSVLGRSEITPTYEFDELARLPGVKVVPADKPVVITFSVPGHSWMKDGVMIGTQQGSGGAFAGCPIGRLYYGYRDLAHVDAGSSLYNPDTVCLSVEISIDCSFDGNGTRELIKSPDLIYDASKLGVMHQGRRYDVPWEECTPTERGIQLSPEWIERINQFSELEAGEITDEFCELTMSSSPA